MKYHNRAIVERLNYVERSTNMLSFYSRSCGGRKTPENQVKSTSTINMMWVRPLYMSDISPGLIRDMVTADAMDCDSLQ